MNNDNIIYVLFNGEWYLSNEIEVANVLTRNNIGGFTPIEIDESRLNDIIEYSKIEKLPFTYHIEKRNNKYYLI